MFQISYKLRQPSSECTHSERASERAHTHCLCVSHAARKILQRQRQYDYYFTYDKIGYGRKTQQIDLLRVFGNVFATSPVLLLCTQTLSLLPLSLSICERVSALHLLLSLASFILGFSCKIPPITKWIKMSVSILTLYATLSSIRYVLSASYSASSSVSFEPICKFSSSCNHMHTHTKPRQ